MRTKLIGVGIAALVSASAMLTRTQSEQRSDFDGSPSTQVQLASHLGDGVRRSQDTLARLFAGPRGAQTVSAAERTRRVKAIIDQFKTIERLVPRETFDLDSVAATAGREPARFHQWVREHTVAVPYRGSLRGARGTLMDRVGNSLDRSLLLAGMLRARDFQVRLARATLTSDQVLKLSKPSAVLPVTATFPPEALAELTAAFAAQTNSDPTQVRQLIDQTMKASQDAAEGLRRRARAQSVVLLKSAGMVSAGTEASSNIRLEALQDHWWVQLEDRGDWKDLDPDLASAGVAVAPADETIDPDSLPDDVHHSIHVRVIIEKWDGSGFHEDEVISADVRPSEVLGNSLRLRHVPIGWPKDFKGPESQRQRQFRDAALTQHEWQPVFTIGDRRIAGPSILDTGDLNARPGSRPEAAGGVLDALGGAEPAPPGMLTAEWIEYEIVSLGLEPRKIRRQVFDVVGPSARLAGRGPQPPTDESRLSRSLSLMSETEILLLACQMSAEFLTHLAASSVIQAESILENLSAGSLNTDQLEGMIPFPGLLHGVAVSRADQQNSAGRVYFDTPNIFSQHTFPKLDSAGQIRLVSALDIVANEIAVNESMRDEQLNLRVEHGVFDANLEAMAIGPTDAGASTADLFPVNDLGADWIVIRVVDEVDKLAISTDLKARIQADVRSGFVAVVRKTTDSAGAFGWWRIDPRTGDTLSFGDRGWGQVLGDYAHVGFTVSFNVCLLIAPSGTGRLAGLSICTLMGTGIAGVMIGHTVVAVLSTVGFLAFTHLLS